MSAAFMKSQAGLLVVQRSDSAADEICPDHLKGEPGLGEAKNPGGGNRELRIVGINIAPVASVDRRRLVNLAECWWVLLLNPAPPASPLLPPLLLGTIRICLFLLGPRDPSDTTGNGAPLLDAREEIVAEERRVGMHPGETLAEVRKKSHARHGIWSKV